MQDYILMEKVLILRINSVQTRKIFSQISKKKKRKKKKI